MKKKSLIVLLVLIAFAVSGGLYAASTFGVGLVNYYDFYDLEEGDSEDYIPGLRGEFFFSDYLGVSADAMVLDSNPDTETYLMLYLVDVVFRIPLGLVEPYVAIGPGYLGVIQGDEAETDEDSVASNIRAGVDFNILDWLSVGIEANLFKDDVQQFFEQVAEMSSDEIVEMIKDDSLIGISAKIKF